MKSRECFIEFFLKKFFILDETFSEIGYYGVKTFQNKKNEKY